MPAGSFVIVFARMHLHINVGNGALQFFQLPPDFADRFNIFLVLVHTAGNLIAFVSGDLDAAKEMVDRAAALHSNSARVWKQRGYLYQGSGQAEEAILSNVPVA